ncbi:nucleotide exchange factor GrpE [Arthrobacter parietis]|uniref:Protein GrpE n=1 Tax=Arthrobacter parietis TaxID=271434 RepID=A0ABN3APG6_9MICC
MTPSDAPASRDPVLEDIRTELANLTDLFRRRLMDDKARNSLYESLKEQARVSQNLLSYRAFESLFRETLLAIDRLQSEPTTPQLVESAVSELLEVFARRNLRPINDTEDFDPRLHEVIGTVPATERAPAGSIVAVHRRGYSLDDRLLRPTQVTVAVAGGGTDVSASREPDDN